MPQRDLAAVILAAGKGTRMKSGLSKLAHDVMGEPIVRYVVDACRQAGVPRLIAVVGHDAEAIKRSLGSDVEYVHQPEQLGTGHALMVVEPRLRDFVGDLFVLVGDAPFITSETLSALLEKHRRGNQAATFLTAIFEKVPAYGRIVRDSQGQVRAIVEEVVCTPEQKLIREVNSSHYCFRAEVVLPLLKEIKPHPQKGEYFLNDIVEILNRHGHVVDAYPAPDPRVAHGINDRRDLMDAIALMREQVTNHLAENGVTLLDPATTFIDSTVTIGRDTVLYPNSFLASGTIIGEGCHIGPFVELRGAKVGDGARLAFVSVVDETIQALASPEPFQRIGSRSTEEKNATP